MIHMNAKVVGVGTSLLVALIFAMVVVGPRHTNPESSQKSENYRQRTPIEEQGRDLYMRYGCQYCHSQYIREVDWGLGAERIAEAGDYDRVTIDRFAVQAVLEQIPDADGYALVFVPKGTRGTGGHGIGTELAASSALELAAKLLGTQTE